MDEAPSNVKLLPCKICGRTFNSDVLAKHAPICQKSAKQKRKVFDSGRQRATGSDVPYNHTIKPGQAPKKEPERYRKAHEATRNNWRYKHEQLVDGMRAARGAPPISKGGGGGAPPPMMNPGMEACRYCGRTFNRDRVEKHEEICGKQSKMAAKDMGNRGKPGASRGGTRGGMAGRGTMQPQQNTAASRTMGGSSGMPPSGASRTSGPPARGGAPRQPGGLNSTGSSASRSSTMNGSMSSAGGGGVARKPPPSSPNLPSQQTSSGLRKGAPSPAGSPAQVRRPSQKPGAMQRNANTANNQPTSSMRGGSGSYNNSMPPVASSSSAGGGGLAKFCGHCGTKFSGTTAKFCYECGAQRGR